MPADCPHKRLDRGWQADQKVILFAGCNAIYADDSQHRADRLQALPLPPAWQPSRRRHDHVLPTFGPPAVGFFRGVTTQTGDLEIATCGLFEGCRHSGVQLGMVGLERQNVLPTAGDDLGRDLFLTAHRVDGDRGATQIEQFQQQRNGRDFVGFAIYGDLPQRQPGVAGPGRNQMQRILTGRLLVRAAQRFAVAGVWCLPLGVAEPDATW